jgi:hypothetical protein
MEAMSASGPDPITPAPIAPDRRVLVQLITLQAQGGPSERALYSSIEWGADALARRLLSRQYRSRILLRGSQATVDGLVDALAAATADPQVQAVDLLLHPHGTSRRLLLADRPIEAAGLAAVLQRALSLDQRRRLRVALSTACYGMSHNDSWLRIGFAVAVGARGIYADGLTSVPVMLRAWSGGQSLRVAVERANTADRLHQQDRLAAAYYRRTGRPAEAAAVDSTRVVDGAGGMVIGTDPATWRPSSLPA